ncbi:MAG TPA: type I polyketide synthase, partial [Bryobacteraceae bacterium]
MSSSQTGLDIAIIGMAGRFPGARSVDEFWRNIKNGVEGITFFSDEQLLAAGVAPAAFNAPNYVRAAGALEGIELFDASFFGFTPREAEAMDPQQRLFLECSWEALENAGYDPEQYNGLIGVYAGAGLNAYLLDNLYSNPDLLESLGWFQVMILDDKDYLTTRVAYKLNLKGPAITVQTACSTSLVAIHQACQGLLNYHCDISLAGGVSIHSTRKAGYFYQEGMILSPDGHCRVFDALAQGTVPGSGVGIVVLKRLHDAIEDGDHIYAVIKGTAVNNDGSLKIGYTAPSIDGQAEVISMALAMAELDPSTISYIEAHGTGTSLGDPIEIAGLTKAFRTATDKKGYCAIGAVKSNIGHTDTAAGVAGVIKTAQALRHKLIPPSLHFSEPNPKIDFANSPFYVSRSLSDWPSNGGRRRAAVSSFGIGGTNAHAVMEEAPPRTASSDARASQLIVLSAKTGAALGAATKNLLEHLKEHPELDFADAAYTLQAGRRVFNHRRVMVCRDREDAVNVLEQSDAKRILTAVGESSERPVAFMFPGQGAQYVNMGLDLYRSEPEFREQIDLCSTILASHLGLDLRDVLYPKSDEESAVKQLNQTAVTQPALFVVEYCLARLIMHWGVKPQAMIGHSIGEFVAACLAGVFSLEDALAVVGTRARLMNQLPAGSMLAVPLSREELSGLLGQELSLAAVNGPSMSVVSGPTEAVEKFEKELGRRGVESRRLHTSHAFHSKMMDPMLEPFADQLRKVKRAAPNIPYLSNVSGTWITAAELADPYYWTKHLRQAVRFSEGVQHLLGEPGRVLLEVGPGQTLTALARQQAGRATE